MSDESRNADTTPEQDNVATAAGTTPEEAALDAVKELVNSDLSNTSEFFAVMEDPAVLESEGEMQFLSDFLKEEEERGTDEFVVEEEFGNAEVEQDISEELEELEIPLSEEPVEEEEPVLTDESSDLSDDIESPDSEIVTEDDEPEPDPEPIPEPELEPISDPAPEPEQEPVPSSGPETDDLAEGPALESEEELEEPATPFEGDFAPDSGDVHVDIDNEAEPPSDDVDFNSEPTAQFPVVSDNTVVADEDEISEGSRARAKLAERVTQMMDTLPTIEDNPSNSATAIPMEDFSSRETMMIPTVPMVSEEMPEPVTPSDVTEETGTVSPQPNTPESTSSTTARGFSFDSAMKRISSGYDDMDVQELGFSIVKRFSEMYAKSQDPALKELSETLRDYCDWHDGTFYDLWETIGHDKAEEIASSIQDAFARAWREIGQKMQADQSLHSDGKLQTRDENGEPIVPMGRGPINAIQRAWRGYDNWQLSHMAVSEPARVAVLLRELSRSAHGWPSDYPETPKLTDVRDSWPNDTWCNAFVKGAFESHGNAGKTNQEMGLGYAAWTQDCLTASNALLLLSASLDPDDRVARALRYGTDAHRNLVVEKGNAAWMWVGENVLGLWD